jgi:hypothetical protein
MSNICMKFHGLKLKLFTAVINRLSKEPNGFVTVRHFQTHPIFVGKVRSLSLERVLQREWREWGSAIICATFCSTYPSQDPLGSSLGILSAESQLNIFIVPSKLECLPLICLSSLVLCNTLAYWPTHKLQRK